MSNSGIGYCGARPTSGCTRLPTAQFINGSAPTTTPLIEGSLAGSAAGNAQRWAVVVNKVTLTNSQ